MILEVGKRYASTYLLLCRQPLLFKEASKICKNSSTWVLLKKSGSTSDMLLLIFSVTFLFWAFNISLTKPSIFDNSYAKGIVNYE